MISQSKPRVQQDQIKKAEDKGTTSYLFNTLFLKQMNKEQVPRFIHGSPLGSVFIHAVRAEVVIPNAGKSQVLLLQTSSMWLHCSDMPMLFPGQYKYFCKRLCYMNVPEEGSICLGISLWHTIVLLRNALK